jgi:lipoyl-dependent peroxiredoxin
VFVRSGTSVEEEPMVAVQRTAEVDWTGSIARGSGRASGGSGALGDLPITVASRFGEPEGKTSPEELIAAAHAACFSMALGSVLAARRTPPEHLRVTATVTLEMSGTPTIASSQLEVHGVVPGADAASFDQAARETERSCPVSRALQGQCSDRRARHVGRPVGVVECRCRVNLTLPAAGRIDLSRWLPSSGQTPDHHDIVP